jgi:hypothetical protein
MHFTSMRFGSKYLWEQFIYIRKNLDSYHFLELVSYHLSQCGGMNYYNSSCVRKVESSWNVTAQGDVREGKWRGSWRMKWVASTLHTTSEHGVSSITTADVHNSAISIRPNWRPHRFKWTLPFRRKTKYGLCACAITFQPQSTSNHAMSAPPLLSNLLSPKFCTEVLTVLNVKIRDAL